MTFTEEQTVMLDLPGFATLVTLLPDGQPQGTVMWHRRVDDRIYMVASERSRKVQNLLRDPRATIVVSHPENGYEYVELRCTVEVIQGDRRARDELARIGSRYIDEHDAARYAETVGSSAFALLIFTPLHVVNRLVPPSS